MPEDKLPTVIDLLKQVCDIMESRDLAEVYLREGAVSLRVRRGGASMPSSIFPPTYLHAPPSTSVQAESPEHPSTQSLDDTGELIKAPMPGMFYRAPSPEESSFVEVGDIVSEADTLCLIEAMKIFNEVKPDFPCEIFEILAENSTVVEFDQPLFRVRRR